MQTIGPSKGCRDQVRLFPSSRHLFRRFRRALLPELVVFAYRPADEMRINSQPAKRAKSPEFGKFLDTAASRADTSDVGKEEHVLILEFLGGPKSKDAEQRTG